MLDALVADPRYQGALEGAFRGAVGNPACGDVLTLHILTNNGRIGDASFESLGSPYQRATASLLCTKIIGAPIDEARRITAGQLLEPLQDLPRERRYLARLAVEALHLALQQADAGIRTATPRRTLLDEAGAARFILAATHHEATTSEVEQAASNAGVLLPGSTPKSLSCAARAGLITGRIRGRSWAWTASPAKTPEREPEEATP